MVIKVYISGISASKEVKKRQLQAQYLLESYKIKYETIDVADPAQEKQRDKMLSEAKRRTENVPPQPPQFFNEDDYCGDFEDMENANENDELMKFLKLTEDISIENGIASSEGEYDLFDPNKVNQSAAEPEPEEKKEEEEKEELEEDGEEKVNTEVREQITVNGVVYDIPPDRKITIGGRTIDVDELMAEEGESKSLSELDDNLKEGLINGNQD